ncbi:hypothetical protein [Bacillus massilinigeriensis]|uniref:hypothetical protein n=1 Tax=Bacillus massilionigeriensis TaxID=1805475 RepID=UPI00096AF86E|nr:hypothetical protein [Bacillus massilionigeriensis]
MLANIFQLAAGVLLGISSFIKKDIFQFPVFGEKLPGTLENSKQSWIIRLGLVLLIIGYALQILDFDLYVFYNLSKSIRVFFSLFITGIIIALCYCIANALAKSDYEKAPLFTEETPASPGIIAIEKNEEVIDEK